MTLITILKSKSATRHIFDMIKVISVIEYSYERSFIKICELLSENLLCKQQPSKIILENEHFKN